MKATSILLAILLAIGGIGYYYTASNPDTGKARVMDYMKLGLDLKGGVHMVLEGVPSADTGDVTAEKIEKAKSVIENRINKLGVSEPVVQIDGKNRIIVQIADVQDTDKAREIIGKTAVLKFVDPEQNIVLDGRDIEKAGVSTEQNGTGYVVTLKMKGEGTTKFYEATKKFQGQIISIMLDDIVISAPKVNDPIPNGEAIITGGFTAESATQLADLINGGALPVKLEVKEVRVVTATLGADSIAKSAQAGIVGMLAVLAFMILLYRLPGLLANIALAIYALLTMGFLLAIGNVFTLPGIAGILLGLGMAVDGNVIIFERIKEELRKGKGLRSGIDAGFHRAYVTVLDSQVTTAIASVILWYLGTGPVKGFAITLFVGTVLSMFTAVTVTRWLVNLVVSTGRVGKSLFGVKEVAQ